MSLLPKLPVKNYTVVLWDKNAAPEDKAIHYVVLARDADHAREYARKQYPDCDIAGVVTHRP